MRLAEWSVARTDGTSAEVIVYYFGEGRGGSAEANIARWSSQFTSAEGGPVTPRVGTMDGTAFLTTVAEYVETEEIRARIRSLGVDYGQGFAIARPVPVAEVLDVLPVLAAATPGTFLLDENTRDTGS